MPRRNQDSGDGSGAATRSARGEKAWVALLVLLTVGQAVLVARSLIG